GLGTTMWNGLAPSRSSASSASCTLSCRDCVSERIAAVSPGLTAQRANTSVKASIHFPSMRSASMSLSRVIAGLDPAIHHLRNRMDARIKPAHDEGEIDAVSEHVARLPVSSPRQTRCAFAPDPASYT